jgi:hypothetical protein
MTTLKKTLLAGVIGASAVLPFQAMAQSETLTCSGAPPFMAPLEAKVRHEETVRVGSEIINKVIYALNTIVMLENNTVEFERHLKFVLDLQEFPQAPNFYIETIPPNGIFNEAAFRTVWQNNALRFKYRKRDVTNWIVQSYSDENCKRTITLHGLGHTYGVFESTEPANWGFHKSRTFLDFDRIRVTIVETSPNVFRSREVLQYTESSFPLVDHPENGLLATPAQRDPLFPGAPAALPLDLTSR